MRYPMPPVTKEDLTLYIRHVTLRDYFAANATDEDVKAQAERLREVSPMRILPEGWRSTCRYMHADAMLKERDA
ncbi:MAG: hypothetical protein RL758_87 [Pseudomonadota bacterium]|jgi:hypothetical protein